MAHQKTARRQRRTARSRRPTVLPRNPVKPEPVDRSELLPAVKQLFTPRFLDEVLAARKDPYRDRILRVEIVAIALIDFVLRGLPSIMELVKHLRKGEVADVPAIVVSRAAFYKRLTAISHDVFLGILRAVTQHLASSRRSIRQWVADLAPFADEIYAIDDTTLDRVVRKTKILKQHAKGDMATLGGRLGCALDLKTGAFAEVLYDADADANEKNHIRPLIEQLGRNSLFIFDLGYFAFPLFDFITDKSGFFISRLRNKTSYKSLQVLTEGSAYRDQIIYLGKYRSDRAAHPVRLVELQIDGKWWRYITNVLSPSELPADKLWVLYAQRWTIEKSFAVVKRSLGMAFLHPCHENGMLSQIWTTLAVYQVLQDLRLEIAAVQGWGEDEVSWHNLMQTIATYAYRPQKYGDIRRYLADGADELWLNKSGTRKRRATELPSSVRRALRHVCEPRLDEAKDAIPRQSKPEPRKKKTKVILAGLS